MQALEAREGCCQGGLSACIVELDVISFAVRVGTALTNACETIIHTYTYMHMHIHREGRKLTYLAKDGAGGATYITTVTRTEPFAASGGLIHTLRMIGIAAVL